MLVVYQLNKFEHHEECLQTCIDFYWTNKPAIMPTERVRICSTIKECEEYAKEYVRGECSDLFSTTSGWEIERVELDTSKSALVTMLNYEGMPCHSAKGIKYWKNPLYEITDPPMQKLLLKQLGE
tara:strand:- start:323 stop:697 length:375 start_codon:yes stop_codon:yes gene_type:complete